MVRRLNNGRIGHCGLSRQKSAALLAALLLPLLLARERIVPSSNLVEAIWDGAPPMDPTGALPALVSRARRLGLSVNATAGPQPAMPTQRMRRLFGQRLCE